MLLLNCCIAFTVANVRRTRQRDQRTSIIRRSKRQDRTPRVSFSNPLAFEQVPTHSVRNKQQTRQLQDIELVDLSSIPPRPVPDPPQMPKPQASTLTPCGPAPQPPKLTPYRPAPAPPTLKIPNFPQPLVPTLNRSRAPSLRSLTTRQAPSPPLVPIVQSATLPRQSRSAQKFGMPAQVPVQSVMTFPRQSHSAQKFGTPAQRFNMPAQLAVPIVQSVMGQNTAFPRATGKKRSRNDDLSQNALFQKCLQNNSK